MKPPLVKTKVRLFITLFFIALFTSIVFFSIKISKNFSKTIIQSFQEDQLSLVKTLATKVQQIINHLNQHIGRLSTLDAFKQENPQAYAGLFESIYHIFAGKISSIYKIDQNMYIQYVHPFTEKEIGKYVGHDPGIQEVFLTKKPTITPVVTLEDGSHALAINYPILGNEEQNQPNGVLCCTMHMDILIELFLPFLNTHDKGIIWIIDQEGTIIYHPDPQMLLKKYNHIMGDAQLESPDGRQIKGQIAPHQAISKGIEARGIYPFWGKEMELYSFTPLSINSKKWLIGITTPYDPIHSPIKKNNFNMFLLTLAFFGVFAMGGYLLHYANKKRSLLERETEFLKKKAELEEEMKKERDRLHKVFDSMSEGVMVINSDYQIEFMNKTAISIYGDNVGALCSQTLCGDFDLSPCPVSDLIDPSYEKGTFRCYDKKRNRWIEASVAKINSDRKKALVCIERDITEQKSLEENMQASEKKYRTLVNHTRDLIMMQNFHGTVLFISDSVENLLGYKTEEFCHKPFRSFLTDNPINDSWRKEIQGQGDLQRRLQPHLLECKNKQGDRVLLEAYEAAVFDREGQEKQIMGVYRDITERKRLEEQLLESERLRLLSLTKRFRFGEIIGKNIKMQEIYELIEAVSKSKATILIHGESGTGKELVARAIHYQSPRSEKPFIGINCSALSENLLESELFGHVKGAFTGAIKDKNGRFELANGGTLFLDEVGDMSLNLQIKLLRVLQEKEFEKVGGEKTIKVDVHIIAATNKDLKEEVTKGRFREDLYFRLKVVEIKLPPLRDRMDDLPLLTTHFIEKFNQETGKHITNLSNEASRILNKHSWPGNIRELEHVVEHAFVKCNKTSIQARHLPEDMLDNKTPFIVKTGLKKGLLKDEIEKDILINILEEYGWNLVLTRQKLGVSKPTLWRKMKKYGLIKRNDGLKDDHDRLYSYSIPAEKGESL